MIHAFAVFKEINERWNYVSDPDGDYIATASESLDFLGDCDHSILMAAAIRAIENSQTYSYKAYLSRN
jgi:hypothetical protein